MSELLAIKRLTVELPTSLGWVRPVNDVSLRIAKGESLGLVGESGSGKTMLSLALMGLLPTGARVTGEAFLNDDQSQSRNLAKLNDAEWRGVRGREIAMVFQEPMTSLNPVMCVGEQIGEAITAHFPAMRREKVQHGMLEALRLAAVPEPAERSRQYPHQLSGGLRQRVMIAMAIAAGLSDPENKVTELEHRQPGVPLQQARLLIADEPTSALDVTVQKQIVELLDGLRRRLGLGLLIITHDLGVVARVADRADIPLRRGMRSRNSTDAVIPSRAGYPIATLTSMNRYKALSHYHLPSDTPENVDYTTVRQALNVTDAVAHELATNPWIGR